MGYNPYEDDPEAVAECAAMAKQQAEAEFGDYAGPSRESYEFCLRQRELARRSQGPDDYSGTLVAAFAREADRAREAVRREIDGARRPMAFQGVGRGLGFSGGNGLLGAATPIQDEANRRMTEAAAVMEAQLAQQMYGQGPSNAAQQMYGNPNNALNGGSYNSYANSFNVSGGQSIQAPFTYAAPTTPAKPPEPRVEMAPAPGKRKIEF